MYVCMHCEPESPASPHQPRDHLCRSVGYCSVSATTLLCKAAVKPESQLTLNQNDRSKRSELNAAPQ